MPPGTDKQDQTSARERALGEESVPQGPTTREQTETVSARVAGISPSVAGGPQGTVHSGVDA